MVITVDKKRTCILKQSVASLQSWFHPRNIMLYSTFPSVLKRPFLCSVMPNNLKLFIRKERRISLNQVYALAIKLAHYFEVVSLIYGIQFHTRHLTCFSFLTSLEKVVVPLVFARVFMVSKYDSESTLIKCGAPVFSVKEYFAHQCINHT